MNRATAIFIAMILLLANSCANRKLHKPADNRSIYSPDKNIAANIEMDEAGNIFYTVRYLGKPLLERSAMGIVLDDADLSTGMSLTSVSAVSKVNDPYKMVNAKKSSIQYNANQRIYTFQNKQGQEINIIFRLSNDGVAFRYQLPGAAAGTKKVSAEKTSFHFFDGTRAWLQPKTEAQSGWEHTNPSYEAHYQMDIPVGTASPGANGWVYPALFKYQDTWMLITEAALGKNYCGTALQQYSTGNEYKINFPQAPEKFTNGVLFPQGTTPWDMPWRIIALGSLKTIAESTLGTDLALPAKFPIAGYIQPGKASWSWILTKDNFIVYEEQKKYIDHAADMHWQYCLVDAAWDKKIGYEKIKELAAYAATKNVGLLLWYNSAGDWNTVTYTPKNKLLTHESREEEFKLLQQMGIKGIKVDFFAGDGQSMINYYQDILEDAARHQLLVNFHGATLPRGLQRTYPNLMTTEAVYGYEMITFNQADADVAPGHMIMCAFARNAFDPMDFTPVSLYKIPKIDRKTSPAFELATGIIFLSGIQHYVEGPEGMSKVSPQVKQLMQTIPASWDDVHFIDGFPGRYEIIARRHGNKWYVAGLNADSTRSFDLDLSFVGNNKTGKIFTDGGTAVVPIEINDMVIKSKQKNAITLQPAQGFVIVFE